MTQRSVEQNENGHDGILDSAACRKEAFSRQDLPGNYIDKWNPEIIQRLREALYGRDRRASVIASDGPDISEEDEAQPYRDDLSSSKTAMRFRRSATAESIVSETQGP